MSLHFSNLLLQVAGNPAGNFHPKTLPSHSGDWWITAVLFSSFTMLVVLRVFDYRRLLQLMNGMIRQSSVALLYREDYALTGRVSIMLLLNYLFTFSLFTWQALRFFGVQAEGIGSFGLIILLVIAAYFIKILGIRILGSVFEVRESASEYSYNILLFNKMSGLILFPVVLLVAFARQIPEEFLIWAGIVSLLIFLLYRMLRALLIGLSSSSVSFFYIILYLCTLEMLPFVVMIKVFVGLIQPFQP